MSESSGSPGGQMRDVGEIPPREDATFLANAPDERVWLPIEASDGRAIVGLKAPDRPRGIWRSDMLVSEEELARARDDVLSLAGIEAVTDFDYIPALEVRVQSQEALSALRGLSHIDYIGPARLSALWGSQGCDGVGNPWGGIVYGGPADRVPPGDFAPLSYRYSYIHDAWRAGVTGQGVTLGVLDTGVFPEQLQLFHSDWPGGKFNTGEVTDRWSRHFNRMPDPYKWDRCNHGTRMAALMAAPRDGEGVVGVAYGANLVTVKVGNDVVVDHLEAGAVMGGLQKAFEAGARIVAMAFGLAFKAQEIGDMIRLFHYMPEQERQVLFVGAAGTRVCPPGGTYPAAVPEVVSATGLGRLGFLHHTACGYPHTDVGAMIEYGCSSGRYSDAPIQFGGSSMATAIVAGVCALIWSKYPNATRDEVIDRLYRSCAKYPRRDPQVGYGMINAAKGIGLKDKDKDKEKEKDKDKEDDKLGPKEHDKLGPKESDVVGAGAGPDDWELDQRLADLERRIEELEGSRAEARPFIRNEERPPVAGP